MEKIAIFFGPLNGSVHRVAKLVAAKIGPEAVDLIHITEASVADLEKYTKIIFGISTVGKDSWQQKFDNTDWSHFFPIVSAFNFTGKKVAIFGLGDHTAAEAHAALVPKSAWARSSNDLMPSAFASPLPLVRADMQHGLNRYRLENTPGYFMPMRMVP